MIIVRRFVTKRAGRKYELAPYIIVTWKVWLLFGFIPLWAEEVDYDAQRHE